MQDNFKFFVEISQERTQEICDMFIKESLVFPSNIKVIKEVTEDEQYKNASLANIKEV